MQIQHQEDGHKGKFYIEEKEKILGELVYTIRSADNIVIEHTEVDPSLEGKGVGKQLVEAVVSYARANNIKIVPVCSFAKTQFKRVREWQDVLVNRTS